MTLTDLMELYDDAMEKGMLSGAYNFDVATLLEVRRHAMSAVICAINEKCAQASQGMTDHVFKEIFDEQHRSLS